MVGPWDWCLFDLDADSDPDQEPVGILTAEDSWTSSVPVSPSLSQSQRSTARGAFPGALLTVNPFQDVVRKATPAKERLPKYRPGSQIPGLG